jgi:hypothetical protein
MGKNFSKNQHFADFSACSGHPDLYVKNSILINIKNMSM